MDVVFARRGGFLTNYDDDNCFRRRALNYALVELPSGERKLDAFVAQNPHHSRQAQLVCLASEMKSKGLGDGKWQFRPRAQLMPAPKDLQVEYWNDKDDHSKGTYESPDLFAVSVTPADPADGDQRSVAVPLELRFADGDDTPNLFPVTDYNNLAGWSRDGT